MPPQIHILSQLNSKHTFPIKNHSDIKLPSTLRPSKCSLPFIFSNKMTIYLQVFRHSFEFLCPVFITLPYYMNVGTQVKPWVYFLRNYNYTYNEMYLIIGYIPFKLILFFNKVSCTINVLFSHLRETFYVGRVKLFAEASEFFTH